MGEANPAVSGQYTFTVDVQNDKELTIARAAGGGLWGTGYIEYTGEGKVYFTSNGSASRAAVASPLRLNVDSVFTKGAYVGSSLAIEGKEVVSNEKINLTGAGKLIVGTVDANGNATSTATLSFKSTNSKAENGTYTYVDANDSWLTATAGSSVLINKGSTINAGVVRLVDTSSATGGADLTVNGTLNVGYTSQSWKGEYALWANNMTVGKDGKVIVAIDPKAKNAAAEKADIYVRASLDNAGEISTEATNYIYMANGSKLTLREGSNIKTSGAISQAESLIYLQHAEYLISADNAYYPRESEQKNIANVNLVLESDQVLGGFRAVAGSTLTIDLKGNKLDLGSFEDLDGDLNFSIIINDFANGLISFDSDSKIVTDTPNINNIVLAYANIDGVKTMLELEWQTVGDKSFLYSQALVPEPAQWAAIFGALALAFVAYRRRR